jgi:hypothetical protein
MVRPLPPDQHASCHLVIPLTRAGIGRTNRKANADIVWRHADGTVKIFFMDGAVVTDSANTSAFVDNTWDLV